MSEQEQSLVAELVGGPRCGEKVPDPGGDLIRIALGPRQSPPSLFERVGDDGKPEQVWATYQRRYAGDAALAAIEAGSGDTIKFDYIHPRPVAPV